MHGQLIISEKSVNRIHSFSAHCKTENSMKGISAINPAITKIWNVRLSKHMSQLLKWVCHFNTVYHYVLFHFQLFKHLANIPRKEQLKKHPCLYCTFCPSLIMCIPQIITYMQQQRKEWSAKGNKGELRQNHDASVVAAIVGKNKAMSINAKIKPIQPQRLLICTCLKELVSE